jgi:branched-chain amino acid transport system substrate-binding protein
MSKPKRSAAVLLAVTTLAVAGGCGTRRSLDDIRAGAGVDRPPTGATSLAGASTPSATSAAADSIGGAGLPATGPDSAASGARPSGGSGTAVGGATRPGASAGSGSSSSAAAAAAGGGGAAAGASGGAASAPSRPGGGTPGATQAAGGTPVPNAGTRSPVVIGNVGTYTGPAGSSLADQPVGVQLWVRWVNDRGGVNGHPVKVVVADDGGDQARHRALVQQLVETQGVIALVGDGEVITGASSVDYLTQKGVPVIGNEGGSEWFYSSPTYFTQIPTGQTYWKAVASSVADAGRAKSKQKWASITCTEATTCADADRTWNDGGEIKSVGLTPVYRARASIAQPDFTAECLNARNAGAEILTLVMDAASVQRVAASCARQDFRPLITEVASSSKTSHASDPNLSHGVVASIGHFSWTDASTPAAQEFQAAVKQYLGKEPAGAGLASAWASAKMFEKAAAHMGEPPTAAAVLDGLYAMQGETLGGLVMPLTFTRGQNAPRQVCWMTNVGEGGKWTALNGGRISCR